MLLSQCQDEGRSTPEGHAKATVTELRSPRPLQGKHATCTLVLPWQRPITNELPGHCCHQQDSLAQTCAGHGAGRGCH